MPEKLSLHKKLAQVMWEADRIPKNGTAPAAMGGFKFVQVGDAADAIRKALAEKSVSMIPTAIEVVGETEHPTSSGKMMTTLTVRTTWTLTDGDSGETTVIQSLGSGADMGDKAAPKAQSNAMKYALLMGFLLSTGDDPEQTDTSDRRPRTHTGHRDGNPGAAADRPSPPRAVQEAAARPYEPPVSDDGGLIGIASVGKGDADCQLRQGPDGPILVFRLVQGRQGIKVVSHGQLAEALFALRQTIEGQRCICWGTIADESFDKDGKKITYQVMTLERIQTPSFVLPAIDIEAPPDTVPLFGEEVAV